MRRNIEPPFTALERRQIRGMLDEYLHPQPTWLGKIMAAVISHSVIAIAIIAGYIILTLTGNDGTPLLTALAAYLGGVGIDRAASKSVNK